MASICAVGNPPSFSTGRLLSFFPSLSHSVHPIICSLYGPICQTFSLPFVLAVRLLLQLLLPMSCFISLSFKVAEEHLARDSECSRLRFPFIIQTYTDFYSSFYRLLIIWEDAFITIKVSYFIIFLIITFSSFTSYPRKTVGSKESTGGLEISPSCFSLIFVTLLLSAIS